MRARESLRVVLSGVLPGSISSASGSPSGVTTSATITCTQSPRWSREYPWRRLSLSANGGSAWWVGTGLDSLLYPSPLSEPIVRISRNGLPRAHSPFPASLDRWVERSPRWQRQLEPFAGGQIAPMEPVALAFLTQRPPPLQLNFMSDPVQLLLAVMQPEVLVEALKHRPQVTLLG